MEHGHDVQLHLHTEWLAFTDRGPLAGRRGRNICDFNLDEQTELLSTAANLLEKAGASPGCVPRRQLRCQ